MTAPLTLLEVEEMRHRATWLLEGMWKMILLDYSGINSAIIYRWYKRKSSTTSDLVVLRSVIYSIVFFWEFKKDHRGVGVGGVTEPFTCGSGCVHNDSNSKT